FFHQKLLLALNISEALLEPFHNSASSELSLAFAIALKRFSTALAYLNLF
ncbi:MAG: hypothetical protein J07AB43_07280, partial [Candidatus Nanosalina sp. J07AB43]